MTFLKQSGLYLAGRIVPACIGVAGVSLYTRLLDPATIGQYALFVSTAYLVNATVYTWIRIAALRVVAGVEESTFPDLFATIFLIFCGVSAAVIPIMVAVLGFLQPALPVVSVLLASTAVVAVGWYELTAALLQARLSVRAWSLLNLYRAFGAIVFSLAFIFIGWKANALLAGFVVGNGMTLIFARLWSPASRGSFDLELCRRCFRFGWPQSAGAALTYIAPVVQRGILNAGVGASALGIFAVAQDFGTLTLSSLISAVSLAGIPLAFAAKDRADGAALEAQLRANARLIFAVGLPATVGLCALAIPLSHRVFGPRFWDGAAIILSIVAVTGFAINLRTYYFDQAFELAMKTRPQAIISLVGTIVLIAGCVVLVPRYAAVGAALSALAASLLCLGLSIGWGARVLPLPVPLNDWFKTALATAGMALALAFVPRNAGVIALACEIAGACFIYLALSTAARPNLLRAYVDRRFVSLGR